MLPCFNPNKNWEVELVHFYDFIKIRYDVNFIIVNDGSFNGKQILDQINSLVKKDIPVHYITYDENKGKGYALREGILASESKYAIYTDIDFPFTNESILAIIESVVNENVDIALGNRNYDYYQNNISLFRKGLSKTFRFFIKNILGMKITDTQCGLKGLSISGKEKFLKTKITRYLFDFEFIYISAKEKSLSIKPIGVELKKNVVFSKMKIKILIQEFFNLIQILLFRRR